MTGSPQYPAGFPYVPPQHPQATTALVLGIVGLAACGLVAPCAWVIGSKAVNEIDANPAAYSGRGEANAGKILGIIGSCFLGLAVLAFVGLFAMGAGATV